MAISLAVTGFPILTLLLVSAFIPDDGFHVNCPTMCVSCGCGSPKRASATDFPEQDIVSHRPQYFLKDVEVVYTDQEITRPSMLLAGTDKYVWLAPTWTKNKEDGMTSVQVAEQGGFNSNGNYRYLKMVHDPSSKERIDRIGLLQLNDSLKYAKDHNWDKCTKDLNGGRSATYLYICWNLIKAN